MTDLLDHLVPGVIARNENAFQELYEATADRLASFAFRLLGDRHAAEDTVQQAFFELARAASDFAGDGRALRAWLYRSVRFRVYDETRRRNRHPESPTAEIPDPVTFDEPDEGWDPDLEHALSLLTRRQRAVVLLWRVEGFDPAEIARILGMSRAAVYATGTRAERTLRTLLTTVESEDLAASQPGTNNHGDRT